ncbi:MAG: UDP-N-acetylmuramoyl-L-alanyl-D-glutamate--2,6-diaminopimelate ligase [Eubacteriales bacterium]|nr:UDP-N-acetylmuramoyl-L-alanyl-D-glutamate--2,6-diaminopimelate ligase [Eubacteriales bacterium]
MFKLIDLIKNIDYEIIQGNVSNILVEEIVYDNRKVVNDSLFICIKGARYDTHSNIKELYDKGCKVFIVEREVPLNNIENAIIIKVENSRLALALISCERYNNPSKKLVMIGITGTKGKTSTAKIICNALENNGYNVGMIGTLGIFYNGKYFDSGNTTPESNVLQFYLNEMLNNNVTHVVMECSSQGFMMHRVDGIEYDYSIFTNITPDHIGENEHKDFDEYFYYKKKIFDQSKCTFINQDNEHFEEIKRYVEYKNIEYYTYSIDKESDIKVNDIKYIQSDNFVGIGFTLSGLYEDEYELALPGKYNIYNALAAITVCKKIGIKKEIIQKTLKNIKIDGRMEVVYASKKYKILVDYAHNPVSMENLLITLREYNPKRLVVVFGCGGNRAKERRFGMGRVAAKMADLSILTADNSRYEKTEDIINDIKSTLVPEGGKYIEVLDRRLAIEYVIKNAKEGDLIAVIGKGHEDYNEANGQRTHFLDKEEILKVVEKIR